MKITSFRIFMKSVSILLMLSLLLSLAGCLNATNVKELGLLIYLQKNLDMDVFFVQELSFDEEEQYASYTIAVDSEEDIRLDKLIAIRNVLNEYLVKDKDSYLNKGWYVEYVIQNGKNEFNSLPHDRSARIRNMVSGNLSDELDVIWFELDEEDIPYISDLTEMKHVYFCGNYVDLGDEAMNETIEQIRKLDGLKSLDVYEEWYDAFVEADLNCIVYEMYKTKGQREL